MITPSFALTATERVLPKLALDFTTASLDSRVTFTRTGNTATVINSSGLVASVNADTPRFDYDPITLACKGLLIEESRTNLSIQTEDFANIAWTNLSSRLSVSTNSATAPDGNQTADKLIATSVNGSHNNAQTVTLADNTTYAFSCFFKAAEYSIAVLLHLTKSGGAPQATFNLNTQAVTLGGGATSGTIKNYGNGWYRCTLIFNSGIGASATQSRMYLNNGAGTSFTGDDVSGIYVWGAQLEAGAFATSYIPTTTTALTRNADVATMTGTNFSDWFNASEGTFVTQAMSPSTFLPAHADNGTAGVSISTRSRASGVSGTTASVANISEQLAATNFTFAATNKVALAFKANDFAWSLNGATPATDTSGTLPTVDRMRFGSNVTSTFSGHLQKVFFYSQRLTTAEVQAFSK